MRELSLEKAVVVEIGIYKPHAEGLLRVIDGDELEDEVCIL